MTGSYRNQETTPSQRIGAVDHATLAAAVEQAADSIIMTDIQGTIVYVNPAFTAITGYTLEEAVGSKPNILKSGHHPPEFYQELWKTIKSGRNWQGELINRRKDGTFYFEQIWIAPVRRPEGAITGYIAINRDVTKQREAQETQALLAAIVENSEDSIIACTVDGMVSAFNRGAETIFGYSSAEVIGRHMSIFVPPERVTALERLADKLRRGERFSQYEGWCRRKDGSSFPVSVTGFPIKNAGGKVVAIANILRDDTERKKAEKALRESESRFHSMADGCPSMLWVSNATGQADFVNRAYREFIGVTNEEAQAGKWRSAIHPEDAPAYLAAFDAAVRNHTSFSAEGRMRRADGEWRIVGARGEPRFSPEGEYLGHIGLRADITERKKAEQELQFQHSLISAIYERSLNGVLVVNPEGNVVTHNARFLDVWQISRSDLPNRPDDLAIGAPDGLLLSAVLNRLKDPEAFLKRVHELYADRDASDQCEIELKDGRTLERYSTSLRDANGGYLARAWFFRDISERKRANQALHESEERFRTMADGCPIGIWVTDAQGMTRFVNRAYRTFCGITSEDVEQDAWVYLLHSDDVVAFVEAFERALAEHTVFKAEHRSRRADGEWRWMESYAEPRFSKAGEFLGLVGTSRDITLAKQAELALHESENRFRMMADSCPIGIWRTTAQAETLSVNLTFRIFCGTDSEEFDLATWASLLHEDDAPRLLELFERASREQTSFRVKFHTRRIDGEWRWVETHGVPRTSENGEFLGLVGTSKDITEHIQAELAAKESEDRFRVMAEGCPMPLWITNPEGEIQYVNQAFRQFDGGDFERVRDCNWQLLLHPEDAPAFLKECFLALAEHRSFTKEFRVKRFDGEWRWLAAFVAPRFSPNGEFLGHVGLGADITERQQAEQALRDSEEKFRELTENIREVFWLKEPGNDKFLYISPGYERVWGMTCASFYENPASRLEAIHPDDLKTSRTIFARQDQGEAVETEYRIRTPDGLEKWIRSRAFPVHDPSGRLVRIAGIAEDITESKEYEEQLIRAHAKAEAANLRLAGQHAIMEDERRILRAFLDNVPDLMYVKDIESKFVIANSEVARRMGAKGGDDLTGKTDFDFYPREVAAKFFEDEQRVMGAGEPMFDHEEKVGVGAEGEACYFLTTKVPLFDSKGRVSGIAGIGRDITRRKQGENALRESNRQLREATERANQMALEAETANRAKSEFLANMSHEIRTPMNGVLGMIGLLLGTELEAVQRHYAEVVQDSANSLLTVIDDILDFSKVEAGKLEIDNVDFNLNVLMGDFADAMAGRVGEKPVEFVCSVAPGVCGLLQGDPGRLRQVLMNLVGNAMKFTHHGEVVVHADLAAETDTEVILRFSVRDTGIGIPTSKQEMLFTSFTQVDASTTRQYGGTGLGLAISKKLVELMGGEIGLESREGEGSEFWFTLPLGKQLACRQVDFSRAPVKEARILVVDDNATNREVMTVQLQSWGAAVEAVESGPAALVCLRRAAAAGKPFQVAVLDMMMPGMDGAELGAAILGDDALKSTPLVMMTSIGQRGDALRFKEIGFAAYLVKPVRQSDLFDCLAAVLTGEQKADERKLITHHSLEEARRSNARILLVEDNLTNQEVASGILRRMGWHADVRSNGKQAVQALENHAYDLVLMDVQMPEMDGYEATRIIRDSHSGVLNHNIPIIATTAHAMTGDAAKCLAAGMSDYISKPIDPKMLSKLVEKWLKRKVHSAAEEAPVEFVKKSKEPPQEPQRVSLVFNREAFLERMMGDREFAQEVAAGFVEELPAVLIELKEKVALGDVESAWKHAHKIKGSAANVGGETLRDVAFEMERAGKAGDLAGVVRSLPDLEIQATRLSEALRQWVR